MDVCTHLFSTLHAHPSTGIGFLLANWNPTFRKTCCIRVSGLSSCEDVTFQTPESRWFSSGPSWVNTSFPSCYAGAVPGDYSFITSNFVSVLIFQHGSWRLCKIVVITSSDRVSFLTSSTSFWSRKLIKLWLKLYLLLFSGIYCFSSILYFIRIDSMK